MNGRYKNKRTDMNNEDIEKLKEAAFKLAEMAKVDEGGPEWERWDGLKVESLYHYCGLPTVSLSFQRIADNHNLEMQRVTGTEGK